MYSKIKRKKQKVLLISILSFITLLAFAAFRYGKAEPIENDTKLVEGSELKYYLNIAYDGKDSAAVTSSDTATAEVYSDYIYVEDTLPYGLTFKNFIGTSNGSIGAVKRSDGSVCSGFVVDGTNGLHYDENTRKISFKVKDLKAGCILTVGFVTKVPFLDDYHVNRMDFYNTGYAREKGYLTSSTVHAYIERDTVEQHSVKYEYTGTLPDVEPALPSTKLYSEGTTVNIEPIPIIPGYEFSGWSTEDMNISGTTFVMPNKDITFKGSFTKIEKHKVTYIIEGDKPDNYIVPYENEYAPGETVKMDSTEPNKQIGLYKFLGWNIEDNSITVTNKEFTMPNSDVVIKGTFKKDSYNVTYEFIGDVTPVNSSTILPRAQKYSVGQRVTVAAKPNDTVCNENGNNKDCSFTEWSKENFKMPEEDVVIYGEWLTNTDKFEPLITKEIINKKKEYKNGEEVKFLITVKNTSTIRITNIMLNEKLAGVRFLSGDGYTIKNSSNVEITKIEPGESINVYASYIAGNDRYKEFENEVELVAALGTSDVVLNTEKKYVAKTSFIVSNPKNTKPIYGNLLIEKIDNYGNNIDGSEFTLYENSSLTKVVGTGLRFDELLSGTYYLRETKVPDGYNGLNDTLRVIVYRDGRIVIPGHKVTKSKSISTVRIVNNKIPEDPINPKTDEKHIYTSLKINKIDNSGNNLDGSEFTLYADNKLTKVLGKGLYFNKLKSSTKYYLKETIVPKGYRGLDKVLTIDVDSKGIITVYNYEVSSYDNTNTIEIVNDKIEDTTTIVEKKEPKTEPKKRKKGINPIIPVTVGISGIFFFIIILFKRRKRIVMIYAPEVNINSIKQLDYDTIKNHNVKVIVLADGVEEYINNRKVYMNSIIYEYKDDKFKIIDTFDDKALSHEKLLFNFVNIVYGKYSSKKYDLVFVNYGINDISLTDAFVNSNVSTNCKLDYVLYRGNNNIDKECAKELRKYICYIGTLNNSLVEFPVKEYLETINYINRSDKDDKTGRKYASSYSEYVKNNTSGSDSKYQVIDLNN